VHVRIRRPWVGAEPPPALQQLHLSGEIGAGHLEGVHRLANAREAGLGGQLAARARGALQALEQLIRLGKGETKLGALLKAAVRVQIDRENLLPLFAASRACGVGVASFWKRHGDGRYEGAHEVEPGPERNLLRKSEGGVGMFPALPAAERREV